MLVRPKGRGTSAASKANAVLAAIESSAHTLRLAVETAKREGQREKLDEAVRRRVEFWIDTCREVLEMRAATRQVLDLHRHHGCRFCAPAYRQAQYILDALDSAMPGWDHDHPELFYTTLELNFPELVRHCRTVRKGYH